MNEAHRTSSLALVLFDFLERT